MLATLTEIRGVVAPVDHNTVPVPTAERLTVGLAQVSVEEEGVTLSEGAEVEPPILMLATAEQPPALVSVTE